MLDLAIIGAGSMGTNHARVAMGLRDARVAVVVDPDPTRAAALANAVGCAHRTSADGISDLAQAAVVAVPTELHREVSEDLFAQGLSVLLEKPISHSLESAEAIVAAADRYGKVLLVGHIERFNPTVVELGHLIDRPLHFEAARLSPFAPRVGDGVIVDLMIHDLDIVRTLAGGKVSRLHAVATSTRSRTEDLAVAILQFDNGVSASLTACRVGQEKIRRISIIQHEDFLAADLMRQEVTRHRVEEFAFITNGRPGYRQRGLVEIPFLRQRGEPLFNELDHFVRCVADGAQPLVSGRDAIDTLRLCLDVRRAAGLASI